MYSDHTTKVCTRCGEAKPLEEYHRRSDRADGLQRACKACKAEYDRARYEANRERRSKTNRAWYIANRERKAEMDRAWREANPERIAETSRAWREANKERVAETSRAWQKTNPEKVLEIQARHRARHPDRYAARDAVNAAVRYGRMPSPRDLTCACGAPAQEYHHHLGYAPEHALDVIAVCRACHTKLDRPEES